MVPYLYPVFAYSYFRVVRNQPVKTIINPRTNPIIIPIFTLFIKIPTTNPMMMAKINAISPLRMLGFRSAAMFLFLTSPKRVITKWDIFSQRRNDAKNSRPIFKPCVLATLRDIFFHFF